MPEAGGHNIEIARHLNESEENVHTHSSSRGRHILELVEAIILALVAITTAWSGYQAARWDANQSVLYGRSSRLRVEGQVLEVESNQAKQYNGETVADWLRAEADGKPNLSAFFERRIFPEFRPAFEAWKKTDPLHNPNAPPGPMLMPEFRDARGEEAARKNQEATELFEQGTRAREIGDNYVRVTVGLATVLFLVAMSQRFKSSRIRVMLVAFAFVLLIYPLWQVLTQPRA
jgi:heme/copper-type cytochrome/quinol oxidase subunit 4